MIKSSSIEKEVVEGSRKRAVLILEDETVLWGSGFGASKKVYGEVVFNTGMVGYPEAITDPSYKGQILVQTYPLIGNYGVTSSVFESNGPKIEGYAIHELCQTPSHWASELKLDTWLKNSDVPGIEGIDTRMLTKKIRTSGTMLGILQVYENERDVHIDQLREEVKHLIHPDKKKLAYEVATDRVKKFSGGSDRDVVLIDCGVKQNIIRNILNRKFNVILVPPQTSADKILDMKPEAIVLSNGPGDPKLLKEVIETSWKLVESRIPMLGICLGCQMIALSFGANTYKLKFGHRGQNHPCIDLKTERCYITSQNHGFAIESESLIKKGLKVTLINANDKTVEGFEHKDLPIKAVQFHPESSPGPNDTNYLFDEFFEHMIKSSVNRHD